jgi:hypothetical protein
MERGLFPLARTARRFAAATVFLMGAATYTHLAVAGPAEGPFQSCSPDWHIVSGPAPHLLYPGTAISASSATDAWLVAGTFRDPGLPKNLIEHWDGVRWTVTVAARGPGYLRDVSAVSSVDAWAVGATDPYDNGVAEILRWDGVRWGPVATPSVGDHSELDGVDARDPSDAWAVGWVAKGSQVSPLIERWNGTVWTLAKGPKVVGGYLFAVTALAEDDVWAVGDHYTDQYTKTETLVEHWDGTAWAIVTSPNPGATNNGFLGVEGVSADDVWAVGSSFDPSTHIVPMAQHWDGTQWTVVDLPPLVAYGLHDVAAVSADDVWAVGGFPGTLVTHWDGSTWSKVAAPNPSDDDWLSSVAALPTGEIWASGIDDRGSGSFHPLTLRSCENLIGSSG